MAEFSTPQLWDASHLSDIALSLYRSGQLPPKDLLEVDDHLFSCSSCHARLPQTLNEDNALTAMVEVFSQAGTPSSFPRPSRNSANEHLSYEQLFGFVEGTLTSDERLRVEAHQSSCSYCTQQIEEFQSLKQMLEATPMLAGEVVAPIISPSTSIPPMIVPVPAPIGQKKDKAKWWHRFLMPLESAGVAALAALLIVITQVSPLKNELENQRALQNTSESELRSTIESTQNEAEKLRDSLKVQKALLDKQLQQSSQSNGQLRQNISDLQNRIGNLNSQINRQRNQLNRLGERPGKGAQPTASPTRPPQSQNHSNFPKTTLIPDGDGVIIAMGKQYVRFNGTQALSTTAVKALTKGELPLSSKAQALRTKAPRTRGIPSFQVISPVATRVRQDRPTLKWHSAKGASSYQVTLRDEDGLAEPIFSDSLKTTEWTVPEKLRRGHRYTWTVQAFKNGSAFGLAPQSPQLEARFEVLSEQEDIAIELKLQEAGKSLLMQSLILAEAGLKQEAEEKLRLLAKPQSGQTKLG